MRSAIPNGTRLIDVTQKGPVLVVDVTDELQQLNGEALIDGVAQIVLTASEITGVSKIAISDQRSSTTVAGERRRAQEQATDPLRLPRSCASVRSRSSRRFHLRRSPAPDAVAQDNKQLSQTACGHRHAHRGERQQDEHVPDARQRELPQVRSPAPTRRRGTAVTAAPPMPTTRSC